MTGRRIGKKLAVWLLVFCLGASSAREVQAAGISALLESAGTREAQDSANAPSQAVENGEEEYTQTAAEEETMEETSGVPGQEEPFFGNMPDDVAEQTEEAAAEDETVIVSDEESVEIQLALAREGSLETLMNRFDNLGIVDIESGYLNVREKPSEDGKVIGKMVGNDICDVQETSGSWYYILSGPVEGYVAREYIVTGDRAISMAFEAMDNPKITVDTDVLNVRTEPSEDSEILDRLDENERYDVIKSQGDWIQIELDNDSVGYVSANYVTLGYTLGRAIEYEEPEESIRQQIVDYAMQFIGNPYVWGGVSLINGCDCSGFTMKVYQKFGVQLDHYSVTQAEQGRRVSSDDMQPGDLIFYAKGGTINHVTMYIGNGKCVGAQSERAGIQVRSWTYRTPVKIVNVLD